MRSAQAWAAALAATAAGAALVPDVTVGWIAAASLVAVFAIAAPRGIALRLAPLAVVLTGIAATAWLGTYGVP